MFTNNLNGLWDFCHGTNMGAGLPKVHREQHTDLSLRI